MQSCSLDGSTKSSEAVRSSNRDLREMALRGHVHRYIYLRECWKKVTSDLELMRKLCGSFNKRREKCIEKGRE